MHSIMAVKKSRKRTGFVHLQQLVKGIQGSKLSV